MSAADTFRGWCSIRKQGVPWEVRRTELAELAAVVGAALLVQVATDHGASGGDTGLFSYVAFQLALPFGAAFALRRSVGQPAFLAAAIMSAGLLLGALGAVYWGRADLIPTNAYVAAGMVWVIAGDPGTPRRSIAVGATILALAMTVTALI